MNHAIDDLSVEVKKGKLLPTVDLVLKTLSSFILDEPTEFFHPPRNPKVRQLF